MSSTDNQTPLPVSCDLLQQAMQAHRSNDVDQARALYEQLLAADPGNADGLHLYGVLQGQLQRNQHAMQLIGKAIEINPLEPMFHNNLGNVCVGAEQLDAAERHYRRAIELQPGRYDAINNLAVLLGRRGDFKAAEETFLQLLKEVPGFTDARQNLVHLLLKTGRVHEAVEQCINGLVTEPRNRSLRKLLGRAYVALDMRDEAVALYRSWLAAEPESVEAMHHLAALTGEQVPDQASAGYVRATFDHFADSFDAKLAALDYRAPELVTKAVVAALGPPAATLRVADAGCGTGLCGPLLKAYASRLVGVDLSPPMLDKAAARGVYDELVAADLVEFLAARRAAFDVLVSADTLCYFGRLEAFAAAAQASLSPGGVLVFTVESHEISQSAAGWRLQLHGRYSHLQAYVQQVLVEAGFAAPQLTRVVLRQEAAEPVHGWLVSAQIAR